MDVFDDLETELARIDVILDGLSAEEWRSGSAVPDWSIADVVLHLAQTNEFVVAAVEGGSRADRLDLSGDSVDAVMQTLVEQDRAASYGEILDRWRESRTSSCAAIRAASPDVALQWVAAPLKPRSLATTRLAEHWAHGLDITTPLGISYADTDRLRHVAWLAHRTLPYAFATAAAAGGPAPTVYAELVAPSGATWRFGEPDADVTVHGAGGAWCRLGARRLTPEQSGLVATGERSEDVLRLVRNYAA